MGGKDHISDPSEMPRVCLLIELPEACNLEDHELEQALHDTLSRHGCSCECDCCGCVSSSVDQVYLDRAAGTAWVHIANSKNY